VHDLSSRRTVVLTRFINPHYFELVLRRDE
jgi:hypothetical protein